MSVEPGTEVIIVDFQAGRVLGHSDHYLGSLEEALRPWTPVIRAPYRSGDAPRRGLGRIMRELAVGWRAFSAPDGVDRIVVVHTPAAIEKLLLVLAWLARRRRVIAVYVLRRSGDDVHAKAHPLIAIGSRAAAIVTAWLIRRDWLYPVSDSALALAHWKQRAKVTRGTTVSLPPPAVSITALPSRSGGPVVALPGCFRMERGAQHYDTVIETAVRHVQGVTVHVQLSEQNDDGSARFADALRARWHSDPRVHLHEGYLSDEEYGALLAGADVVVLPYDAESYTTGTSGVIHESLALGATVLTAPLAWAIHDYGDHPRIRFVDGWDAETVRRELPGLVDAAAHHRSDADLSASHEFARSWQDALEGALSRLRARGGRAAR